MAYRSGTYVAFHAEGNSDPTERDMKYYRMLQAWHQHEKIEFSLVNSHDESSAVRDSSKRETLRRSLMERLRNSQMMLLIVGDTTRLDSDWVPFEIAQAIDSYKLPIITAYRHTSTSEFERPAVALAARFSAAHRHRLGACDSYPVPARSHQARDQNLRLRQLSTGRRARYLYLGELRGVGPRTSA